MSSHEHLWKKGFSKPNSTPVPNPFKIQRRRAKVLSPTLSPQEKLQLKQQADQISQLGYNSQKIPIQAPAPTAEASPIHSKAGDLTKQQPTTDAVEIQADASEVQDETKEPDDLAFAEASDASAADSSIQRQEIPDSEAEAIPESDTDNIEKSEEETEIQAKAKQPARNFLELPINAPGTSPSSIQRQGNLGELGNSIQQQPVENEEKVEPDAEQEAQESDETIQRQEIPEAEADEISSSESQTVQRQGETSDTPDQQTEQSEEYHNFLEIPVNVPGTPSSSIPRQVNLGRLSNQVVQPIKPISNPGLNRLNTFKSQRIESPVKPVNPVLNQSPAQTVQRQDNTEDEDIQNQPFQEPEEETVQKKEAQSQSSDATATPSLEQSIQQKRGSGQALSENVRQPMEQAFGADFSQVKVHTDSESDKLNKSIQAKAFTTGKDIFFKKGEYQPDSKPGQELLAHELTHVVQQNGNQVQAKSVKQVATKSNKLQPKPNLTPTSIPQPKIQRRENPQDEQSSAGVQPQPAQPAPAAPSAAPESGGEMTPATPQVDSRGTGAVPETAEPGGMAAAPEMAAGGAPASATEIGTQPAVASDAPKSEAAGSGAASPASPEADPDFQATVKKAKGVAEKEKQHDPAESESKEAQDASEPPSNEVESKAQDKQVQEMEQQPPGEFNAEAFKAAVMDKVNQAAPKTLEDADKFKDNNLLSSVKDNMSNQAKETAEQAAGPVAEKTQEAPDTSEIEPKQVKPLDQPDAGSTPGDIGAAQATPKPKPESEVSAPMQAESQKLDQQMAEADVTPEQLASSNEPQFVQALDTKKGAQQRAVEAPQEYRQQEQGTLNQAQSEAQTTSQTQLQGMHGEREQLLAQVMGRQDETKTKDEQERDKVAKDIDGIYQETKTDVEGILNGLDTEVTNRFKVTADTAKQKFEDYVAPQMEEYKKRYDGLWGAGRWVKDKLMGVPPEVTAFFDEGRNQYLNEIDKGLTDIANYVSEQLNKAKERITEGREEIKEYVAGLPEALKQVGTEAAQDIQTKFDDLEQSVKDKETELVDKLAQQYQENLQQLDAQIKEMKASNQPWFAQAFDAMAGVIDTINKLKNMLQNVLAKAASAIGSIIKDPIGFLGNLVSGVKQGLDNFIANIMNHLQGGLIGWLTGAMGSMGILLPDDIFSLKGIFSLVTQILGMTWDYIRRKAVKLFGEPMVAGMEKSVEIFQIIANQGPMGLWEQVQEQFGDLKETVIEEIKGMLITQVITAGVKWIIGLLNPASAFVKAAMAIYDIVMFFINQGSQVVELVNAVIEAITAIASGAVGGAAKLVENALVRSLPVVIGFLASLLGISGLAKKVQNIVKKIRSRIDKAIDKVLKKAKSLFKGKKGKGNKDKKGTSDKRTKKEKAQELTQAINAAKSYLNEFSGKEVKQETIKPRLNRIKRKYKLKVLEPIKKGEYWGIHGEINPKEEDTTNAKVPNKENGKNGINPVFSLEKRANQLEIKINSVPDNNPKKWECKTELQQIKGDIEALRELLGDRPSEGDINEVSQELKEAKAKLKGLEEKLPKQERDEKAELSAIVNKATHIPPAQYSRAKHWRGNSEEERRQNSANGGPGQFLYSMTPDTVRQLEKDTLLTGDVIDKGSGTYHAYKQFSQQIGYANGEDAYWLRAELTGANSGAPTIHSHPRLSR
ncbi:eCIS core domain-containing protein [Coleofasciculus sp. E2-BRE-01]|uniref:eCIS core domain-containing protein n=1 Tax=Coleofasciculus sp. E2-BRE-01 TaxID=3069524 RepID=UPI0032F97C60